MTNQIDISQLDTTALKALAYEAIKRIEMLRGDLQIIENAIAQKQRDAQAQAQDNDESAGSDEE